MKGKRQASCPRCGLPDNGSISFEYYCNRCSWPMSSVVHKKPDGTVGVLEVGEYNAGTGRYWSGAYWLGKDHFLSMYRTAWQARVARVIHG